MLDLEIAGVVRDLAAADETKPARAPTLVRLRESHHQVARLFAHGLRPAHIATQTGYALSRLSVLQGDPAFQELVEFYKQSRDDTAVNVEARFLGVALDGLQELHERILDDPDSVSNETLIDSIKVLADRAGFAPVTRSINKNLNLTIAKRMDEKIREREEAA